MTKRSRFSLPTLSLAVCFILGMVSSAVAECAYFKPLGLLAVEMRLVATGKALPATPRRVARHVQNVELGEVRLRLQRMNLSAQFRHIQQLVSNAAEYSRTKRTTDQVALARNVHKVIEISNLICGSHLEDGSINHDSGESVNDHLLAALKSNSSGFKIGLLLFTLTGLIGFMVLLKYAAGHAIGMLQHKKMCRVPAQIWGNEQTFPGFVTRAGLNGVRFEFDCDAVAKRLTDLMARQGFIHFDLRIGDDKWPVFVDGYHKFFSPLYFLTRLTRNELDSILARSTRATQNAPSIGHKSTRGKWREQIKRRKADIQNTSRQRAGSG